MTMARTWPDILFRLMKECQFFSCVFNTENRLFSFKITLEPNNAIPDAVKIYSYLSTT